MPKHRRAAAAARSLVSTRGRSYTASIGRRSYTTGGRETVTEALHTTTTTFSTVYIATAAALPLFPLSFQPGLEILSYEFTIFQSEEKKERGIECWRTWQ